MKKNAEFPVEEARAIVKDLFKPNPAIYWSDFLFHVGVGWGALFLFIRGLGGMLAQAAAFSVATLAMYRAVIFIHELAHFKRGTFRLFRFAWNSLCGLPMLVPSFTYNPVHNDHHRTANYGLSTDGEYFPFARSHPARILLYLALNFISPALMVLRFAILTPLSHLHGGLRVWVWRNASSLAIDTGFKRPGPSSRDEPSWRLQEWAAFGYAAAAIAGGFSGWIPAEAFGAWYALAVAILLINSLRTLAAHRYRSSGERPMSVSEQFLDSVNIPGNALITPLWAPVGLRYHATHHLFPAMPYHALGSAHRRLIRELPESELYLSSVQSGLLPALVSIWREARASRLDPV